MKVIYESKETHAKNNRCCIILVYPNSYLIETLVDYNLRTIAQHRKTAYSYKDIVYLLKTILKLKEESFKDNESIYFSTTGGVRLVVDKYKNIRYDHWRTPVQPIFAEPIDILVILKKLKECDLERLSTLNGS